MGYSFNVEVEADSAILINAKTGKVLYEKEASTLRYPASVTKVATALFILEEKNQDLSQMISPSDDALLITKASSKQDNFDLFPSYRLEHDGYHIGIKKGEILPFWAAFYGMLIGSGNDAANVVAESCSLSIVSFIDEMNLFLKKIGCENTHFMNPHGLHHPDHYTTAYDLALIAKKALESAFFREIVSSLAYVYPQTNRSKEKRISHNNRLIKQSSEFYYPNAIGIKTGYTKYARNTLIAAAEKEGRELIAVILGAATKKQRYQNAIKLFETAFKEEKKQHVVVLKDRMFLKSLDGAKTKLKAHVKDDMLISYYPSEKPENIKAYIHWNEQKLPIEKNQPVGIIFVLSSEREVLAEKKLYSAENVTKTFFRALKDFLLFK